MSFNKSFKDVLEEAKKAFESVERTYYEKSKIKVKPYLKSVGFVNGTRTIIAYR